MTPAAARTVDAPTEAKAAKEAAPEPTPSRPDPIIHRLELTPEAKRQSEAVADRLGMTQIAALSRLVGWFAGRSPEIQAMVINGGGDAARPILEKMANRSK